MAACVEPVELWSASESLSGRVAALRAQYFSFTDRAIKNEVRAYTTGEPDDILFSPHQWGVAPEAFIFAKSFQDNFLSSAEKVPLPAGFWQLSLAERRATFFAAVIRRHLPVSILDGELIVGSYFNTALSRNLDKKESKRWRKLEKDQAGATP